MTQKVNISKKDNWIEVNMGAFILFPENLDELKKLNKEITKYITKNERTKSI